MVDNINVLTDFRNIGDCNKGQKQSLSLQSNNNCSALRISKAFGVISALH